MQSYGYVSTMSEVTTVDAYVDWTFVDEGNFGKVYRAYDVANDRYVAIKRLRASKASNPDVITRLEREVDLLRRLDDERIVKVYEYVPALQRPKGFDARPSLILEYVDGATLSSLLRKRPKSARLDADPLTWSVPVTQEVLGALNVAHSADEPIIHRDIKPENVMLRRDGRVKVLDFGIARIATTTTATAVGTPAYQAPEQAWGRGAISPATDVYAVGGLLFELLTGRRAASEHAGWDSIPLPSESDASLRPFDVVVKKALQREPEDRYQSASEMRAALSAAAAAYDGEEAVVQKGPTASRLSDERIAEVVESMVTRRSATDRLRSVLWAALALVIVVLGAGALLYQSSPKFRQDTGTARDKIKEWIADARTDENKSDAAKTPGTKREDLSDYSKSGVLNAGPLVLTAGWAEAAQPPAFSYAVNQIPLNRPSVRTGYKADVLSVDVPNIRLADATDPYPADTLQNSCSTPKNRKVDGRQVPGPGVYLVLEGKLKEFGGSVDRLTVDPAAQAWGSDEVSIFMIRAACKPSRWPTTKLTGRGAQDDETRTATFIVPIPRGDGRSVYGLLGVTTGGRTISMPFNESLATSTKCSSAKVCIRKRIISDKK